MADSDLDKLLGGFAADTLTQEERQALFTTALNDQQLFNALADEQALKELLADPAVRRRLLQALEQSNTTVTGGSSSWLEWLRRPVGLAWAGGLAAAALAGVLGTTIYQDSLREAAQSVQSEAPQPTVRSAPTSPPPPPSVAEPEQKAQEKAGPTTGMAKSDASSAKTRRAKQASKPPASEKDALDSRQALQKPPAPPATRSTKTDKESESQAARKEKTRRPAPAAGVPEPKPMPPAAAAPPPEFLAENIGARALFYAGAPIRGDRQAMAKERRLRSAAEAPAGVDRPESALKPFSDAGSSNRPGVQPFKPLGFRYSFVVKEGDGQDREVDAATAAKSGGRAHLTMEANQDGYLQVLTAIGSEEPQVLFPAEQTAQPLVPVAAGNRIEVPLPPSVGREPITLTVRLSRKPFESGREQKRAVPDRISSDLVVESVSPGGPAGLQEQAVYVVSQDLSPTTDLTLDISLSLP